MEDLSGRPETGVRQGKPGVLPKRWMRVARFILLAYRKFDEERCYMRAPHWRLIPCLH